MDCIRIGQALTEVAQRIRRELAGGAPVDPLRLSVVRGVSIVVYAGPTYWHGSTVYLYAQAPDWSSELAHELLEMEADSLGLDLRGCPWCYGCAECAVRQARIAMMGATDPPEIRAGPLRNVG